MRRAHISTSGDLKREGYSFPQNFIRWWRRDSKHSVLVSCQRSTHLRLIKSAGPQRNKHQHAARGCHFLRNKKGFLLCL